VSGGAQDGWRHAAVTVGFANFFDLYDIFLGGVLAAVLAEARGLDTTAKAIVIASGSGGMSFGAIALGTLAERRAVRPGRPLRPRAAAPVRFATRRPPLQRGISSTLPVVLRAARSSWACRACSSG
jgi:MFS family permease